MYYKCDKVNFRRGGSSVGSPDWIKKKKATINPRNEDGRCFQYGMTVTLDYGEFELLPERVSNIKPSINKYNRKGMNYPLKRDDWEWLEKNNSAIGINILYFKEKEICSAHVPKINWKSEKEIIRDGFRVSQISHDD